jgi:PAS domain S-box-containing protein
MKKIDLLGIIDIFETVREPLLVLDENLNILSANRSFYNIFKVEQGETIGHLIFDVGNKQWDIPALRKLLEDILPTHKLFDNYEVEHDFPTIGRRIMLLNARQIYRKDVGMQMILLAIEDITERKRLENLLIESEEHYRRIFETTDDGILLLEKQEGNITHANMAAIELSGYSKEECIGKKLQDIGVSIDMGDFQKIVQTLDKGGVIYHHDVPIKTKAGPSIYTDIYLVDRTRLVQCNIRDVTERKLKEAEREKLLHDLSERVKESGCINDLSRLANKPLVSIEEFVQEAVNILPPAYQYPEICCARIMLDSKEFKTANFRETEWSQVADIIVDRKKFGAMTICYLEEKPAADEGPFLKEERSLLNTVADFLGHVIQHRLSDAEIRASEERFKIIFDNANDGILLADKESKIFHFANVAICRMLGYSQEEIKNMGVMDIHPEKDIPYVIEQFEKQSRKEIEVAQDLPVKRKDGSVFYADVNAVGVEISGKRYVLGIFRNITKRKQDEKEIKKRVKELEDFYDMSVGRELKMIELKNQIKELKDKLAKYEKIDH